jgi:hypothetical protein
VVRRRFILPGYPPKVDGSNPPPVGAVALALADEAALRWRSQFALEPGRCYPRFHRIAKRDQALMNIIAGQALECSDVKACRAGGDSG